MADWYTAFEGNLKGLNKLLLFLLVEPHEMCQGGLPVPPGGNFLEHLEMRGELGGKNRDDAHSTLRGAFLVAPRGIEGSRFTLHGGGSQDTFLSVSSPRSSGIVGPGLILAIASPIGWSPSLPP